MTPPTHDPKGRDAVALTVLITLLAFLFGMIVAGPRLAFLSAMCAALAASVLDLGLWLFHDITKPRKHTRAIIGAHLLDEAEAVQPTPIRAKRPSFRVIEGGDENWPYDWAENGD
jgi:hypothetical protein